MNKNYKNKYLKYKNKYLKLKGGSWYSDEDMIKAIQASLNEERRPIHEDMRKANQSSLHKERRPIDESEHRLCSVMRQLELHSYLDSEYPHITSTSPNSPWIIRIKALFPKDSFDIIDVRGDGLCMVRAIFTAFEMVDDPIKFILGSVKKYFDKYKMEEFLIQNSKGEVLTLNYDTSQNDDYILSMIDDNNLDNKFLTIFSEFLQIDILALSYDSTSSTPFVYSEYKPRDEDVTTIFLAPVERPKLIILNTGGHWRPITAHGSDPNIKNDKYREITSKDKSRW